MSIASRATASPSVVSTIETNTSAASTIKPCACNARANATASHGAISGSRAAAMRASRRCARRCVPAGCIDASASSRGGQSSLAAISSRRVFIRSANEAAMFCKRSSGCDGRGLELSNALGAALPIASPLLSRASAATRSARSSGAAICAALSLRSMRARVSAVAARNASAGFDEGAVGNATPSARALRQLSTRAT